MEDTVQLRVYGSDSLPTLIYFPGLHGDWTLVGAFRHALTGKVRFVEMTYPRTLNWSLDDYAAAIVSALAANRIADGWLLGESFGSQPMWALVARGRFQARGIILAGGFVKHPMRWAVRLTEKIAGKVSLRLLIKIIFGYAKIARFRFRKSPEIVEHINEFVERRTELDKQAATHRLHLIAESDFPAVAAQTKLPVYGITGILDPIVPWPWVQRWLKKNCPTLHDYKVVRADHNVLGTGTKAAAEQILKWVT